MCVHTHMADGNSPVKAGGEGLFLEGTRKGLGEKVALKLV